MAQRAPTGPRILGIDPGLHITGYGLITAGSSPAIIEAGVIRPPGKGPLADRLAALQGEIVELLEHAQPEAVAVEKLYAHYAHPRTAILMGHARGVILAAAAAAGLAVTDVPSTQVKKSLTGHGHASKSQMQQAVADLFGLDAPPEPADVADAIAIALCAARRMK